MGVTFSLTANPPRRAAGGREPAPSRTHRPEDDPLAVAVLQGAAELRGQLLLIDVRQQVAHRAQHNHLHTGHCCELGIATPARHTHARHTELSWTSNLGLLYILFWSRAFFLHLWLITQLLFGVSDHS